MSERDTIETFCQGDLMEYVVEGASQLESRDRRAHNNWANPIAERYGAEISEETANIVKRLYSAVDASSLIRAARNLGFHEADNYSGLLRGCDLEEDDDRDLGRVLQEMDEKISYGLAPRDKSPDQVSNKKHREAIYIPDVIEMAGENGTVFMAKSLGTTAKVEIAWDLHPDNVVLCVDDYEKWEGLFGWRKLKELPHGKNEIKEELGDQLSPELLKRLTASDSGDDDTKDDTSTDTRGRRTRTKPSDEVLNVALSSRHRDRTKMKSENILEAFKDDGYIGGEWNPITQLILFPTTTELNMTDHWWVAGKRWEPTSIRNMDNPDMDEVGGYAAIANCNKGTFEYLNQRDEVWHIEDYLEQAGDYEFETNHGAVTMDTIDRSKLVLHVMSQESLQRFTRPKVFENMPSVIPEYADNELYRAPDFPHEDDMMYAAITQEDVFWMRPVLREQTDQSGEDAIILSADETPRGVGEYTSMSSDYKLYARARLPEWDFSEVKEMALLDRASHYMKWDRGAHELLETLAMLHDEGQEPYSQTPEARWTN